MTTHKEPRAKSIRHPENGTTTFWVIVTIDADGHEHEDMDRSFATEAEAGGLKRDVRVNVWTRKRS